MITQNYTTITPAYGRDYKSAKAAKEDFLINRKDFILQPQEQYCSISDFAPGVTVNIRYKRMTQVAVVKVPA